MIAGIDISQLGEFGILGVLAFVLWRKVEAHHKGIAERLKCAEVKIDECEVDRAELRGRIIEMEKRVC